MNNKYKQKEDETKEILEEIAQKEGLTEPLLDAQDSIFNFIN